MEIKASGNQIYISDNPVVLKENCKLVAVEPKDNLPPDFKKSWSLTATVKVSRKVLRWMTIGYRRQSRFMKQLVLLKRNRKHYEAIFRCIGYGDKIPRKYMRIYEEAIKTILIHKNR